jgi:hypothetical protein
MEPIYVRNSPIIIAGDMSGDLSSSAIDISDISNYAVQFSWVGTAPVGSVNVLISNDGVGFDLLASAKSLSGNSGTLIIKDSDTGYKYVKAIFTFTSGVGSLNASISGKRN